MEGDPVLGTIVVLTIGQFRSVIVLIAAAICAATMAYVNSRGQRIRQYFITLVVVAVLETPALFSLYTPLAFVGSALPLAAYTFAVASVAFPLKRALDRLDARANAQTSEPVLDDVSTDTQ